MVREQQRKIMKSTKITHQSKQIVKKQSCQDSKLILYNSNIWILMTQEVQIRSTLRVIVLQGFRQSTACINNNYNPLTVHLILRARNKTLSPNKLTKIRDKSMNNSI